jgi:copper chaperone CopZ
MSLSRLREVYGIRSLALNEAEQTVRLEYDATRLTEATVRQLVQRAGVSVLEQVSLVQPVPAAEPAAAQ